MHAKQFNLWAMLRDFKSGGISRKYAHIVVFKCAESFSKSSGSMHTCVQSSFQVYDTHMHATVVLNRSKCAQKFHEMYACKDWK
jgi:hypothetical protein